MDPIYIRIPSDVTYERVIRASAAEVAAGLGFDMERIEDLKLAVSEAVSNAIDHGNGPLSPLPVEVTFTVTVDHLEVQVLDHGAGIERIDWSKRVVDEEFLEQGMLRGFGMYLISALVDDYNLQSLDDGTRLTLRICRKATPASS